MPIRFSFVRKMSFFGSRRRVDARLCSRGVACSTPLAFTSITERLQFIPIEPKILCFDHCPPFLQYQHGVGILRVSPQIPRIPFKSVTKSESRHKSAKKPESKQTSIFFLCVAPRGSWNENPPRPYMLYVSPDLFYRSNVQFIENVFGGFIQCMAKPPVPQLKNSTTSSLTEKINMALNRQKNIKFKW